MPCAAATCPQVVPVLDSVPIELQAPDIGPLREGNSGVDYVHVFDSGQPGPNEICGAIALRWLWDRQVRPLRGTLTLALANVEAYARFDTRDPHASRFVDEDLNRVWGDAQLLGARDSSELRRARQLRPFVDAADFLLDIHSMSEPCRPIMVCGTRDKNADFARQLGVPADLLIDTGHPAGLRMVERGGFGDAASPRRALLVECGQHWERAAQDVAIDTTLRFLVATGSIDAPWARAHLCVTPPAQQRLVRVTEAVVARSMDFRFLVPPVGLGIVAKAGTPIAQDGDHVWRAPHDDTVLVMPSLAHLRPGNTQVRLGRYDPTSGTDL
jgi:predicted deacylase